MVVVLEVWFILSLFFFWEVVGSWVVYGECYFVWEVGWVWEGIVYFGVWVVGFCSGWRLLFVVFWGLRFILLLVFFLYVVGYLFVCWFCCLWVGCGCCGFVELLCYWIWCCLGVVDVVWYLVCVVFVFIFDGGYEG